MASTTEITRKLAGMMGNGFTRLFGNVLAWFWLAMLLIVLGAYIVFAPIKAVGDSGRSLSQIVAVIGVFLLVGIGAGWAWYKLSEEHQWAAARVGASLWGLIAAAPIIAVAAWLWWSWNVPDIWNRPLGALTLGDIAQNVIKLIVLLWGIGFVSAVIRNLIAAWRKG